MSIIDEIRAMSPKERTALSNALKELEPKQEPEPRQIGEPMHGAGWDPQRGDYMHCGITLTEFKNLPPEKQYDLEHPLVLREYGYRETVASWGKPQETKYWSKREIDAYNEERKLLWLEEKRKIFPDATLPD